MQEEYEIVSHPQLRHLNIFLVRLISRTTHLHREIELGMILDGALTLQIGTESYRLEKNDIYLVNPLDAHEFQSEGAGALILSVQISKRMLESIFTEPPNLRYTGSAKLREHYGAHPEQFEILSLLCLELAYAYFGHNQDYGYQCYALATQLIYHLKRWIPNQSISQEEQLAARKRKDRILSVTDYIDANFTHKLLLEDIARNEGLSMMYLSHLFKDTFGLSFQEYLKEKRFEYACNLIVTTQRSILDISVSSGFSDVRYLTKLFQERFGCTPREYRAGVRQTLKKKASAPESIQSFFTEQDSFLLLTPLRNQLWEKMRTATIEMLFGCS